MSQFFAMGGHAAFIWPSYAIVFFVLVVLVVNSYRALKSAERDLADIEEGDGRNAPTAQGVNNTR